MMTHLRLLLLALLLSAWAGQLQAGPIICGSEEDQAAVKSSDAAEVTPKPSEVNQFVHYVQCSLERAKPWIEDLETEAKRLEANAKRLGLRIANRFNDLLSTLIGAVNIRKPDQAGHPDDNPDEKHPDQTDPAPSPAQTDPAPAPAPAQTEPELATRATESPAHGLAPNEADNEITNAEPLK